MIENLFPVPIYQAQVNNLDVIQSEMEQCVNNLDFNLGETLWDTHYLSDPTFSENAIQRYKLKNFAKELKVHVKKYIKSFKSSQFIPNPYDYKIKDSWFALFKRGQYGHIHSHGDALISGAYYVNTNGKDGYIFFMCPTPSMEIHMLYSNPDRVAVLPQVGRLLLFPGWLKHGITTNKTDNNRVTLSFNLVK